MALTNDIFQIKASCIEDQTKLLQKICSMALYPEKLLQLVQDESNKLNKASIDLYRAGKEAGII